MKKISLIKKFFKLSQPFFIGTASMFFLAVPFVFFAKNLYLANNQDNVTNLQNDTTTIASRSSSLYTYIPSDVLLSGVDNFFVDNASIPDKENNKEYFTYDKIYASQHFGDEWLQVEYVNGEYQYTLGQNSDLTKVHQGLKTLVISAAQNLPETDSLNNQYDYLTDDTYMKINNFYVDNYNGEIIVNVEIGAYYDNSGILVDTVAESAKKKLNSTVTFSGFKIAEKTQFSSSVVIYDIDGEAITNENITSFVNATDALTREFVKTINNKIEIDPNVWGETQTQFNTTAVHISEPNELGNEVTIYPGLKQLRTNIGVNNFFGDLYIDTSTFKIYADNPQNNRVKIGTFIPEESLRSSTLRKFFANYDNSNSLTTYIREGTYNAVPSIRNTHPSDVNIELLKDNMFRNTNDFLANPVMKNIDGRLTNLSALEIITTNEDLRNPELGLVNNITGEVTVKAKVGFNNVGSTPGEYKYQGQVITSETPEQEQLGRERIFTIVIDGFLPIKSTSIATYINASNYNFAYKPSEIIYEPNWKNSVINLLKEATENGYGFLSVPGDVDTFFNDCVDLKVYNRPQGGSYYGVPNDKNGTLFLTIELKKYYNQINGLLVDVTADNSLPTMTLTTTIQDMQTVRLSDKPVLKSNTTEPTYIDWYPNSIPTELLGDIQTDLENGIYSGEFTKDKIQDAIYEYAIEGSKTESLKNNIDFTTVSDSQFNDDAEAYKTSDQYKSINDDLTSNIDGTLNIYFHISGVYDEDDGIEITVPFQESYLFRGFKRILPTNIIDNVYLANQKIYATDITDTTDPKEALAKSILTLDASGRPFNLRNLFEDTKGIPDVIVNELINKSFPNTTLALSAFNDFFEIIEIHNSDDPYYYQSGEITASIALKVYYDEKGKLIDTRTNNNESPLTKRITFSGYENASPSSIVSIVGLNSIVNDYASDYNDINKLEDLILRNFSEIGENFPKKFLDNTIENNGLYENSYMNLQNPTINNLSGRISVDVNISSAYFDRENIYIESDEEKIQKFSLIIEGFAPASATVIKPIIKLNDLNIINDEQYKSDLIYWSEFDDGNPSDEVDVNYLRTVITNNIDIIVNNPYESEKALTDNNYFSVENPRINYGNGSIEFDLILNYYFRGSDAYPISPQNPNNSISDNNRSTVNIIGFDRCYETTANDFDVSSTILKDYTASYVKNLWDNEENKATQMILNTITSNEKTLNAILKNLPSVYFQKNNDGILEFASRKIQIQQIDFANDSNDRLNIEIVVDAAFIRNPNNGDSLNIGTKVFTVTFDGFKSGNINTSINNDIWDIDRSIVYDTNISYWNSQEVAKDKLQILLSNNNSIYESFIDNLVYDSTGRLISQITVISDIDNPIEVVAKNGTVTFSGYVKPYYDENGNEQNDDGCTFRVQIRNFKTQNPTTINQNTIYTDELTNTALFSNEDPLFGKDTVTNFLHKEQGNGNALLKDALINHGGRQIIEKMLSNTQADYAGSSDKTRTIIDDVKITAKQFGSKKYAGDDFNGSLTFKIWIKNYFDNEGVWNITDSYEVNEIFTIYQSNLTQKTNLSNTDASVGELAKFYKEQNLGNLNFSSNIKASEFYNEITSEANFGFFEDFMESLVDTGIYGMSAKNTPTGWSTNTLHFEPLELNVYNDSELSTSDNSYKSFIDFNDEEGWVSIKVKYSNVYEEDVTIFADVGNDDNLTFNTLSNTAVTKEMTLRIVGFNKDTQTNDFIIIIAAVASSIGFILILSLLIVFIIKKAREHH